MASNRKTDPVKPAKAAGVALDSAELAKLRGGTDADWREF